MNEFVLFILIAFLFLIFWHFVTFHKKNSLTKGLILNIIGFMGLISIYFITLFSFVWVIYYIFITAINLELLSALSDNFLKDFNSFIKIYENMQNIPEQKLNYDIFKQIFVIDPKSFVLVKHNLFYVDENKKYRKFYMGRIDLYRALKLIDEYQTKGINSNATPITDDMLKKIKREHEKGEKLQAEAIEGLTKASENWNK